MGEPSASIVVEEAENEVMGDHIADMSHHDAQDAEMEWMAGPQREMELLKAQLEAKQREIDELRRRAELMNAGHGHEMVDEVEVPEWARESAELERLDHGRIRAIFEKEDAESPRLEDEIEVTDPSHFLHVRFRCDGQPFPAVHGRPGFPLSTCRCSHELCVKDLLPMVPEPAAEERIECVLDAARALAVWWGQGSISAKSQRIMDRQYLALSTKAVGVAYAFFRTRCSHVLLMAGLVPSKARIRHSLVSGWPWDMTRVVEFGFEIGRRLEWSTVAPTVTLADEHSKILLVIPECLTRLKHCHGSREVVLFYYRSFFDLSRKNTRLFADEVGRVVVVLPPREPEDPYSWIPFVGAVDLWLACGAHVWLVNGPRSAEDQSWDRMNQKARSHVLSYIDHHPQFLEQLHDKTPPEAGTLSASMACLKVGLVRDPRKWWTAPQAVEFYNKLRVQLQDDLTLGEIRMPKSVKETPAGTPSGSQRLSLSGTPAVKDGRISKRHLKRVERRRQRSEQKKLEKQMEFVSLGI